MILKFKVRSTTIAFIAVLLILIGGAFLYLRYDEKQLVIENLTDDFEDQLPSKCEDGEWASFPAYSGAKNLGVYKGDLKLKGTENLDNFTNEDGSVIFTVSDDYSPSFFIDRLVAIEGVKTGNQEGKEVYINKIKCIGEETNKKVQNQRAAIMAYVDENINEIAPEKSANSDWQVETFYFHNETDFYVEYESVASFFEEAPYDARLWLVRASYSDENSDAPKLETLAYIHEDAEDPEKNILKQGEDIYKDVQNFVVYEFDGDLNRWTLE